MTPEQRADMLMALAWNYRQAQWGDGAEYKALRAAILEELAPGEPLTCAGVGDSRCNYLARCGGVCNKCGEIHDGQRTVYLRSQRSAAEPLTERLTAERDALREDAKRIIVALLALAQEEARYLPTSAPVNMLNARAVIKDAEQFVNAVRKTS